MNFNNLISRIYHNKFFSRIFHTSVYCLQRELKGCRSVLDLGCGPNSPLQYCRNIKYSVGVEPFKPYLKESKKRKIHDKYLNKKIEELDFPENSFDAVIIIEVLEHLSKNMGLKIIEKAEEWAKNKVIITTPNGYLPQKKIDKNPLQKHLSGWSMAEFRKYGYHIFGLAGPKFLRKESEENTMDANLLSPVRYRPQLFWFLLITLSQTFVYFFPNLAFELFCVKEK